MTVFTDRAGRVVASFRLWSDAAEFEEGHRYRGYARRDEPGLGAAIERALAAPKADPTRDEAVRRSD